MTHPAIPVANCQFENRILIYTKKEREFMKNAMNSLSLSGNSGWEIFRAAAGFAGFRKDVVRCGMNAGSG